MNRATKQTHSADALARGFRLQKRWRFCQGFAADLYHSDLSLEALQAAAGSIATAMRAREDAMLRDYEEAIIS